jgi:hypothetical protein
LQSAHPSLLSICFNLNLSLADELPFGAYDFDGTVSSAALDTLHDTLGFNYFIVNSEGCADCNEITNFWEPSGITLINHCSDTIKACTNYHYGFFEAEARNEEIDFYNIGGTNGDSTWISSDSGEILFGPNYRIIGHEDARKQYIKMERKYIEEAQMPPGDTIITYYVKLKLMIDNANGSDSAVAILENQYMIWDCSPDEVYILDTIKVSDFDSVGSNSFLEYYKTFQIPDTIDVDCGEGTESINGASWGTAVVLKTTGIRQLSVDWIKIYDQPGIDLVEHHEYDDRIFEDARNDSSCVDDFWGWYSRDEPLPLQMKPAGYVLDTLHNAGYSNWNFISSRYQTEIGNAIIRETPVLRGWFDGIYNKNQTEFRNKQENKIPV